jgi:hypothetical protein
VGYVFALSKQEVAALCASLNRACKRMTGESPSPITERIHRLTANGRHDVVGRVRSNGVQLKRATSKQWHAAWRVDLRILRATATRYRVSRQDKEARP